MYVYALENAFRTIVCISARNELSDETILGRIHQLKEAAKTNPDNAKQIEELKDIEEFATIRDAQRQRDQNRKSLAINAKSKADRTKSSLDILRKIAEKSLNPYTKIKASIQLARDYTFGPFSNYTDFNTTRLDFWHSEQLLDEVFKKIQKLPLNKVVDEVKSLKLFAFEAYNSLYTTFYRYLSEREVASAIQTNKKYKLQSKTIQDCLERNAHKARDEARKLLREKRQQNKLKPSDLVTEALLEESVVKTEQLTLQSSITELPLCLKP